MRLTINRKELYSAGLMMLIGIGTVAGSLNYTTGTLARMGPGYFPLILGVALILVAALILATQSMESEELTGVGGAWQWRPGLCVVAGVVLFIVLGRYGGLVPATFVLVTVSALGDRTNSFKAAAGLAAVITALAVGIFHYGLKMQFPLWGWG